MGLVLVGLTDPGSIDHTIHTHMQQERRGHDHERRPLQGGPHRQGPCHGCID